MNSISLGKNIPLVPLYKGPGKPFNVGAVYDGRKAGVCVSIAVASITSGSTGYHSPAKDWERNHNFRVPKQ